MRGNIWRRCHLTLGFTLILPLCYLFVTSLLPLMLPLDSLKPCRNTLLQAVFRTPMLGLVAIILLYDTQTLTFDVLFFIPSQGMLRSQLGNLHRAALAPAGRSTAPPRSEQQGGESFFINFLPSKCNFSLKIFVGYKKMLIFAPKFTPLVRIFALSARGQEH